MRTPEKRPVAIGCLTCFAASAFLQTMADGWRAEDCCEWLLELI